MGCGTSLIGVLISLGDLTTLGDFFLFYSYPEFLKIGDIG